MARKIRDSVIVITGASSGIGRATALECARRGGSVVVSARREDALKQLATECEQAGGRAIAVPADVTHQEALDELARRAVANFGRIDAWFNNAGVTAAGRFEEIPADVFQRVIETNLFGVINGTRAVLPYFREQGSGILINHGSVLSNFGASHFSAYVSSKFAIRGFTESIRQELRDTDIHVCLLLPAAIDTPFYNHAANYSGRAIKPVPPVYKPQRVAKRVISLIEHPRREAVVGNAGRAMTFTRIVAPYSVSDRMIATQWESNHFKPGPADPSPGNVFEPVDGYTDVSGGWPTQDNGGGTYVAAGLAATTIPAAILWRRRSRRSQNGRRPRAAISGGIRKGTSVAARFMPRVGTRSKGPRARIWRS